MDNLEFATPIVAYPILSDSGSQAATSRLKAVQAHLHKLIGVTEEIVLEVDLIPDELIQEVLRHELGDEVFDIEDLI